VLNKSSYQSKTGPSSFNHVTIFTFESWCLLCANTYVNRSPFIKIVPNKDRPTEITLFNVIYWNSPYLESKQLTKSKCLRRKEKKELAISVRQIPGGNIHKLSYLYKFVCMVPRPQMLGKSVFAGNSHIGFKIIHFRTEENRLLLLSLFFFLTSYHIHAKRRTLCDKED
jgi:hypothetical protein